MLNTSSSTMPPPRRRFRFLICAMAIAAATYAHPPTAQAQSGNQAPAAPAKKATAPAKPAPAPQAATPSAETILVLIRATLLRLNDALSSGNYTVMRDLAAPSFAQANSAGRLYQIFANLSARGVDLAAVAILAPQLPETPSIDPNGRLRIKGYFPGQPVQIDFDMQFEVVNQRWRLFALSVAPTSVPSSVSAIPPAGAASGGQPQR